MPWTSGPKALAPALLNSEGLQREFVACRTTTVCRRVSSEIVCLTAVLSIWLRNCVDIDLMNLLYPLEP